MKEIRKTEDGAIDNLLRAYGARQSGPQSCRDFDPDLANAYVEHKLAPVERSRYEGHLSACAACRKTIVALVRMAEPEAVAHQPRPLVATGEARPGWLAQVKRAFGAMTAPQWAMAAAAVVIVAVSLPLLLSRRSDETTRQTAASEVAQSRAANANTSASNYGSTAATSNSSMPLTQAPAVTGVATQSLPAQDQQRSQPTVASGSRATEPAQVVPTDLQARADQPAAEKNEARSNAAAAAAEVAPKPVEREQAAPQPAASQSQPAETELAKINREETRSVQDEKDSAKMKVLKPGRPDGGQRDTETAIRQEQPVPPPSTPSRRDRTRLNDSATNSMRQGRLSETVRPPRTAERKVHGRKFWLRGDTWTDKDYNPGKEMPVVSVTRDSDTYRELLVKHSGLKPYFTGFPENERVIVIYKGIVYKLVPQDGK